MDIGDIKSPISITNQKIVPQRCPQDNIIKNFFSGIPSYEKIPLGCAKQRKTNRVDPKGENAVLQTANNLKPLGIVIS